MSPTPQSTVAEIAVHVPGAIPVFKKYGIDFCCGGKRPLSEVCADKGLEVDRVLADVLSAGPGRDDDARDFSHETVLGLVAHIVDRYHGWLRREMPNLDALFARVLQRHGDSADRPLHELASIWTALRAELEAHLDIEEREVFPALVAASTGAVTPSARIDALEREHERAGREIAELRRLSRDYTPPEWACPTYRALFAGLERFESEMHRHVHLENNVLFAKV